MSKRPTTDPRQGNAGSLAKWLANPKNRAKMYAHDREAAKELAEPNNTRSNGADTDGKGNDAPPR